MVMIILYFYNKIKFGFTTIRKLKYQTKMHVLKS